MIPILSSDQIKQTDQFTIANEPVTSFDLMQRAADACTNWICDSYPDKEISFHILCGPGNNGGDGLAIARGLLKAHYAVSISLIRFSDHQSSDFEQNLSLINNLNGISVDSIDGNNYNTFKTSADIIIDSMLGSGLNAAPKSWLASFIQILNGLNRNIIAIDIPSGLFADLSSCQHSNAIIKAKHTLTFQLPKLAELLADNEEFVGQFHILDIGLNESFIAAQKTQYYVAEMTDIKLLRKPRSRFSHKGSWGHVLVIAGSYNKTGAAALASLACIRSGAGLTTAHVPKSAVYAIRSLVPECMISIDTDENFISQLPELSKFNVICIGPGMGTEKQSSDLLKKLIQEWKGPLVIDADGLNILAQNKTWLGFLNAKTILTPHPGEFERLFGKCSNGFERLSLLREQAIKLGCTIILKGAFSAIATSNGKIIFNPTGNPGMATGGSGDVLTGLITGLCAQGYSSLQASMMACWLHGSSADIYAANFCMETLIARDIIDYLPHAYRDLNR